MEYEIVVGPDEMQELAGQGWLVHSWHMFENAFIFLMMREILPK